MPLPDGKIAKTGGRVVKNVAGYDLGKLLTGSFGTLGVIVEASLKLFPQDRRNAPPSPCAPVHWASPGTCAGAFCARRSMPCGWFCSICRLRRCWLIRLPARSAGAELWIEVGGSHRVIERCMLELRHLAAAVGQRWNDGKGRRRHGNVFPTWPFGCSRNTVT